ncbi:malonate--CoA ligase ACSF3, mitochondrial-like [Uloborus diversus]|uniref:malonate--CoA ligase ACSF3, mitochondrial-like n=1 Tax=Uloborus diversus TaxID=327109 RepID=UPI002408F2C9|nr:malonate--CoA ligase ACSF3, mitochondrial-like [Uloborus diversus]
MQGLKKYFPLFSRYLKQTSFINYRNCSANAFVPFYERFFQYSNNVAVIDDKGSFKYGDILCSSHLLAKQIEALLPNCKETCERIPFLCRSDSSYVSVLLACWISGNIAVPLCSNHPPALLEYYLKDCQSKLVISDEYFADSVKTLIANSNSHYLLANAVNETSQEQQKNELSNSNFFSWDTSYQERDALIVYTSGSTGPPKGVVLTHGNLFAQIFSVVKAWEITSRDSILHALPLHHIHGIMNALLCPLNAGGTLVMLPKFNAKEVWKYFLSTDDKLPKVNFFCAVPTMYSKLLQESEEMPASECEKRKKLMGRMRLMSSGSAALPETVFYGWENITGHRLLERFGMSEIGMALANPLHGSRLPGTVGKILPNVEVKIQCLDEKLGKECVLVQGNYENVNLHPNSEGKPGELMIRGPNVFKKYWNKEKATSESFTEDRWFKTGDTACYENGYFKILGRTSVDIIKSGGYKISGLQVESCLLMHPNVAECTVLGVPDDVWGERVTAVIASKDGKEIPSDDLKEFCKKHLPAYAVPTITKYMKEIPRNIMGKVNKKQLRANLMESNQSL